MKIGVLRILFAITNSLKIDGKTHSAAAPLPKWCKLDTDCPKNYKCNPMAGRAG